MKLTKEECKKALITLITRGGDENCFLNLYPYFKYELDVMIELLNEHFDNPPLKFDEIKNNDWIWDDTCKEWIQASPNKNEEGIPCVQYYGFDSFDDEWYEEYTVFEEGRFYRKQVNEDER